MSQSLEEMKLELSRARLRDARAKDADVSGALSLNRQSLPSPTDAEGNPEVTTDNPSFGANLSRTIAREGAQTAGFLSDMAIGAGLMAADTFLPDSSFSDEDRTEADERLDASDAYETILNSIGIRTDPVEPRSTTERLTNNIAAPLASGLGVLGGVRKATGKIGERVKDNFAHFAKGEAAAATAGGGARSAGEGIGLNPIATTGLELFSNVLGGTAFERIQLVKDAARAVANPGEFVRKTAADFTEAESDIAASVIQGDMRSKGFDPLDVADDVAAGAAIPDAQRLTVGAASGNPALQALENTTIKNNADVKLEFEKLQLDTTNYVHEALRQAIGDPNAPVEVLEAIRRSSAYAMGLVEQRLRQAVEAAIRKSRETPNIPGTEGELGEAVKQILLDVGKEARALERTAWSKLRLSDVSMKPLVNQLDETMKEATDFDVKDGLVDFPDKSFRDQITEFVTVADETGTVPQLLDSKGKPLNTPPPAAKINPDARVSAEQIISMRSTLLERAAIAGAAKQRSKARRLYDLADAALETLNTGSTEFVKDLEEARKLSFELNQRFTRDVIGPLLSRSASRDEVVPGNEVMESLFKPKQRGATNIRALVAAADEMPQAATAYIMRRFNSVFANGDEFATKAGEDFLEAYRPALDEAGLTPFIEARVRMSQNIDAINDEAAQLAQGYKNAEIAGILENRGIFEEDLIGVIDSMFRSKSGNSQARLSQMFDELEAATGITPDEKRVAIGGLKSAVVEGALKSFFTDAKRLVAGIDDRIIRVRNALEATGRYTDEQIERVVQLGNLFSKQNKAGAKTTFTGQSNTPEDLAQTRVMERLMKLAFLKKVAPIFTKGSGPGGLMMSQTIGSFGGDIGKKFGVKDAQSLINLAVFDAELMESLLRRNVDLTAKDTHIISRAIKSLKRGTIGIAKKLLPSPRGSQPAIFEQLGEDIDQAQGEQ